MKIELSQQAYKQFQKLQEPYRSQVRMKIQSLEKYGLTITGMKTLKGPLAGLYRLRAGIYRIVFRVQNDTAYISVIQHRKDVYEK